jgi:hypothetical protein
MAFHPKFHKGVSREQLRDILSDPRRFLVRVEDLATEPAPSTITVVHHPMLPVGVSTVEPIQRVTGLHENHPSHVE